MIAFIFGMVVGTFIGIAMVALVSINRFEEDDDEDD
jgi:ABC-type nitrate/sulfonate/bicarbonate transport system permease component